MCIAFGAQNLRNLHFPCHFHVLFDEMTAMTGVEWTRTNATSNKSKNERFQDEFNENKLTNKVAKASQKHEKNFKNVDFSCPKVKKLGRSQMGGNVLQSKFTRIFFKTFHELA